MITYEQLNILVLASIFCICYGYWMGRQWSKMPEQAKEITTSMLFQLFGLLVVSGLLFGVYLLVKML